MQHLTFRLALACTIACCGVAVASQAPAPQAEAVPTFAHDVAPILYAHCVSCHRAGEGAPMPRLPYEEARPGPQAMTRGVADGSMPPWHADAAPGTFANERRLSAEQKNVIARWAAGGAPLGKPSDLPAAPTFADGWRIGTPDQVFELPEAYSVPATGTIEYENFYVATGFTQAKWLQVTGGRPGK